MFSSFVIPDFLLPIYKHHYTFIVLYGGRGGAKSFSLVDYLIFKSFEDRYCQYLCAREIQNSLLASVFSVFQERIFDLGFSDHFRIVESRGFIQNITTNVKIHFKGLWRDPNAIKGIVNLKRVFIDEAASISRHSWRILTPTVTRVDAPQIIVAFNPEFTTDVVYEEFITNNTRKNIYLKKVSYKDNPFELPVEFYEELESLHFKDHDEYLHVYEGHCISNSNLKIFKRGTHWDVLDFEEDEAVELRYGLDLGFTPAHPTFAVRCYEKDRSLYVTHEMVETGLDIDKLPDYLVKYLPHIKHHTIWVDSSRPETISAINRTFVESEDCYLHAKGVEKGQGSVEDGIEHLKSYKMIYVHPRCKKLIENFNLYQYKTDRKGNILRDIEKAMDDGIDALRYSVEQIMKDKMANYEKWRYNNIYY